MSKALRTVLGAASAVMLLGAWSCNGPAEKENYRSPHGHVKLKWPSNVQLKDGRHCDFGSFFIESPKGTQTWEVCAETLRQYNEMKIGDSFTQE